MLIPLDVRGSKVMQLVKTVLQVTDASTIGPHLTAMEPRVYRGGNVGDEDQAACGHRGIWRACDQGHQHWKASCGGQRKLRDYQDIRHTRLREASTLVSTSSSGT